MIDVKCIVVSFRRSVGWSDPMPQPTCPKMGRIMFRRYTANEVGSTVITSTNAIMLTSLWNQITNAESDSSDDESFPTKAPGAPLQEDDITAASLMTSFPTYGSHRKAMALESSSPILNNLTGPPTVSSIVSGDWEFSPSPRRKGRKKNDDGLGGFFSFDDVDVDDGDESASVTSTAVSGSQGKNASVLGEKQGELVPWDDDELDLWSDDSKKLKKKSKKGRSRKEKDATRKAEESIQINADLRRQWIHGSNIVNSVNNAPVTGGTGIRQESRDRDGREVQQQQLAKRPKRHFTFDDDATLGTSSTSSDDDRSTIQTVDATNANLGLGLKELLNEKTNWMPDQLCKTCYACEAQFTVFRRRHHCRLCGQVFCSRCSSFFVEIVGGRVDQNQNLIGGELSEEQQQQQVSAIRTCKMCYEQVSASGPNGLSWYNSGQEEERSGLASETRGEGGKQRALVDPKENPVGNISSFPRVQDGAPTTQGFQGGSSNEFLNLALVKQKLEEDRVRREEEERAATEDAKVEKSTNPIKNISSTITRRFGRLAESAAREAQLGGTGYNDEETKLIGTGVRNNEEDEVIVPATKTGSTKNGEEAALVLPTDVDPSGSSAIDNKKLHAEAIKQANRQLRLTAADYLEKMGRELMRSDAPTLLNELNMPEGEGPVFDKWVAKLMMLATRCCTSVKVDIRRGDALDIRPYCKVKGE